MHGMQFVWKQSRHSKNYIVRYNATLLELLQRKFVKRKYDRYAKESVNSYTQRYNAKWNELRYATEAEHRLPTKRKLVLQIKKESAIRTYINGLREEYANRVEDAMSRSIDEARTKALTIELRNREQQQCQRRDVTTKAPPQRTLPFNKSSTPPRTVTYPRPSETTQRTSILQCTYCKRYGHSEANCFRKHQNFQLRQNQGRPPPRANRTETKDENQESTDPE
ncbi:hypothetical protein QLX08_005561 [Tetragonisca angustula]|uniref:Uncharacterized protein n=1 Tax=Tetragonisca angustula TaxID=166442 RepID=A0AAW1A005_9HYME